MPKYRCCKPVLWKHEDGWDVYPQSECYQSGDQWIPAWFDSPIIEDAPTRKTAEAELRELHIFGVCIAI